MLFPGVVAENNETKGVVQFFNNQGIHLRTLKIPSNEKVAGISWEGNSLRLAMVVGAAIYFANIKSDYKWGYMTNETLVFAYQKADRIDFCVIFWDTKTDAKNIKYVKNLIAIRAYGEFCVLISKVEETTDQYSIILCNAIGSPVDSKVINIEPTYISMSKTHIIVSSSEHIYCWQYKNQIARLTTFEATSKQGTESRKMGRENAWFIDEDPNPNTIYDKDKYATDGKQTADPICCITSNENYLLVGRINGTILKFTLPYVSLESKVIVKCRPFFIAANCDTTRLGVIDLEGVLTLYEINNTGGNLLDFSRKEVWDMKWSEDSPIQFACMEKSRMYTIKGVEPEEPLQTERFLCQFSDLQIRCVLLDEVMKSPDGVLQASGFIVDYETKSLRDTRDILNKVNLKEAYNYIDQNPHLKLWRLLAEKALEDLDFVSAEKALLKCDDYQGLQLVKRLQVIDDKSKQKAEILAYYAHYDEAEQVYKKIERKDLAIQMRMKLGDWFKVVQMVKEGSGYDDILQIAYNELGNYYADRFKWQKASNYYSLAKNYDGMIESFYNIEDFESLEQIIPSIPEGSKLLNDLGDKFQNVGLCEQAVSCYKRAGDVKKAIDCCVLLNQWNLAVELAEENKFMQIEGLLSMYANHLLEKKKKLEAAELYRKANRNTEAAKILSQIAKDLVDREANPLIIKKLYVMAALEVDSYKKRMFDATMTGQNIGTAKTLDSLITSDINTSTDKALNNPWRGAEAWHFYLLAQRQLYIGEYKYAMKTALRLAEYELELDTKKVYSLIATTSFYFRNYKECSKAFVKLEGLPENSDEEKDRYQELAVNIFTRYPPIEIVSETYPCIGKTCKEKINEFMTHCKACGSNFQPCVASGRSIFAKEYYTCKNCKHKMIESEIDRMDLKFCPLCHVKIVIEVGRKYDERD